MKVTFLGTGTSQGIPVIGCDCETCTSENPQDSRLRTSIMVTTEGKNIVIDVGPDFRQQMLANGVLDIDSVLLTHEHNDHIIGMDDVRPFNFRYRKDIPVYCTARVQASLRERFSYAFSTTPYPGVPRFELYEIDSVNSFDVAGQTVIPIEVSHGRMPVMGFRFGDFTYITDAKIISAESFKKIAGSKILVLNALRKEDHHSHLTLEEALAIIQKIQPKQAYLTHLSHMMGPVKNINKILPPNVRIAYDGLVIDV